MTELSNKNKKITEALANETVEAAKVLLAYPTTKADVFGLLFSAVAFGSAAMLTDKESEQERKKLLKSLAEMTGRNVEEILATYLEPGCDK